MYNTLRRYTENFHLWIICFDDLTNRLLTQMNLENVTPVSLKQFEDEALLKIKPQRTSQEYCWTCTPSSVLYVLNTEPQVDIITYLDADLMFFSSPEPIFTKAGDASILLIEHRYLPECNHFAATRGIYNVQFMMFRRNSEGLLALNWWRDRCLEWCFNRSEDNKFGDQKYLDDWVERFSGVHVVQNLGAGLAPWNADQYNLSQIDSQIFVQNDMLIFYHVHGLVIHPLNIGRLCCHDYPISNTLRDLVYLPCLKEIANAYDMLKMVSANLELGVTKFPRPPKHPVRLYRFIKDRTKEIRNGYYYKFA
jgi:hypothetical protein